MLIPVQHMGKNQLCKYQDLKCSLSKSLDTDPYCHSNRSLQAHKFEHWTYLAVYIDNYNRLNRGKVHLVPTPYLNIWT